MSKPLVSVVVLAYNQEKTIAQTLDSILSQATNFDIEIIVGEDCSTDSTLAVCEKYGDKIKMQTSSANVGMLANFIRCLKASKGTYIALCEGDDYWVDNSKLQKQVDFLEGDSSYGICFHDIMIYDETAQKMKDDDIIESPKDTYDINDLAYGNFMHTPSIMLRNDFEIPSWFSDLPIGDWPLYMLQIGDRKIYKLEGKMAVYRVHENGVWSTKSERVRIKSTIKVYSFLLKKIQFPASVKKILKRQRKKMKRHLRKTKYPIYLKFRDFFRKQ